MQSMDKLADLPVSKKKGVTDVEKNVLKQYFEVDIKNKNGEGNSADNDSSDTNTSKLSFVDKLKMAAMAGGVFALLANPYIDQFICVLPYCESGDPMLIFAVKIVLFVLIVLGLFYCYS